MSPSTSVWFAVHRRTCLRDEVWRLAVVSIRGSSGLVYETHLPTEFSHVGAQFRYASTVVRVCICTHRRETSCLLLSRQATCSMTCIVATAPLGLGLALSSAFGFFVAPFRSLIPSDRRCVLSSFTRVRQTIALRRILCVGFIAFDVISMSFAIISIIISSFSIPRITSTARIPT